MRHAAWNKVVFAALAHLLTPSLGCSSDPSQAGAGAGAADPGSTGSGNYPQGGPGCTLEAAAFCETFDTPSPGGRGGEIDDSRFSFSRWDIEGRLAASSFTTEITEWSNPDGPPVMCGELFSDVLPPDDVRVCNGQLNEAAISGGLPINSMMVRQPFDFSDGGTFVFDVDAKRNDGWDGHGWWLEIWVTDEPVPIPYHDAPTIASLPRNGIGFQIAPFDNAFSDLTRNEVAGIEVVRDYQVVFGGLGQAGDAAIRGPLPDENTFRVRDQHMNHFKVVLSPGHIEIWVTDWDHPEAPRMAIATDVEVPFSVGYLHFQHVHYNASKVANCGCDDPGGDCGPDIQACWADNPQLEDGDRYCCDAFPNGLFASSTQVYRWDNIAFDGPILPMLRGYDVPDQGELREYDDEGVTVSSRGIGYPLYEGTDDPRGWSFPVESVDLRDAGRASLDFTARVAPGVPIRYRLNGNAWHEAAARTDVGFDPILVGHTFSLDIPLAELRDGQNVIDVEGTDDATWISNIDLSIQPTQ
jgi:hypothetical protein